MASELPLVLYDCRFETGDLESWIVDKEEISQLIQHIQSLWAKEAIKATIIKRMLGKFREVVASLMANAISRKQIV